jgi:hypothetical protein
VVEIRVDFGSPSRSYDTNSRGNTKVVALAGIYATFPQTGAEIPEMTSQDFSSVTLISTPTLVVNTPDTAIVTVEYLNAIYGTPLKKWAVDAGGALDDGGDIEDSFLILELTPIE